jgi:hypothetical protein
LRFQPVLTHNIFLFPLQLSSRGWFETDETFESRVTASRVQNRKASRNQSTSKSNAGAATTTKKSAPQFTSVGTKKTSTAAWNKPVAKPKVATGGLFAAMMVESDSD